MVEAADTGNPFPLTVVLKLICGVYIFFWSSQRPIPTLGFFKINHIPREEDVGTYIEFQIQDWAITFFRRKCIDRIVYGGAHVLCENKKKIKILKRIDRKRYFNFLSVMAPRQFF